MGKHKESLSVRIAAAVYEDRSIIYEFAGIPKHCIERLAEVVATAIAEAAKENTDA